MAALARSVLSYIGGEMENLRQVRQLNKYTDEAVLWVGVEED